MIRQIFRKNKRRRVEVPSPAVESLKSADLVSPPFFNEESPPPEGIELLKSQKLQVAGGDETFAAGEPAAEEEELDAEEGEDRGALLVTPAVRRGGTFTPEPLSEEERLRQKEEGAMIQLVQKAKAPKKLKFPSKYPAYLKEPPKLTFEETSTSMRRKLYNLAKLKQLQEEPLRRNEKKLVHMAPRTNTAVQLRSSYIRREPLVSQYFSDHYNRYHKPPFKLLRTNNTCYSKLRPAVQDQVSTSSTTPEPSSTYRTTIEPGEVYSTEFTSTVEPV